MDRDNMQNLKVCKIVTCPQEDESVDIERECVKCEHFKGILDDEKLLKCSFEDLKTCGKEYVDFKNNVNDDGPMMCPVNHKICVVIEHGKKCPHHDL